MKYQFSGHDSFICKHFWLKKGYDFVHYKGSFNEEAAVVKLGVGKNMVTSINYWLKAFGITDSANEPTELGKFIFNDNGVDPYLENLTSIWLLHYHLIKTGKASIYTLFFNEFRKVRFEFTKDHLINFINRQLESSEQNNFTVNTINADVGVFIRTYLRPNYKETKIDVEDDYSNLMIDLDLMDGYQSENSEGKLVDWYKVDNRPRIDLPFQVVLYTILDNENFGNSVSFKDLLSAINSPGSVFVLSEEGLYQKIEEINSKYSDIVYTESAGIRQLQFNKKPNKWKVLHECYKN